MARKRSLLSNPVGLRSSRVLLDYYVFVKLILHNTHAYPPKLFDSTDFNQEQRLENIYIVDETFNAMGNVAGHGDRPSYIFR